MNAMFEATKVSEDERAFWKFMQERKLKLFNAQECDVLFEGPCSCGAFHNRSEFRRRVNRGNPDLWDRIVNDCRNNGVPIPDSI